MATACFTNFIEPIASTGVDTIAGPARISAAFKVARAGAPSAGHTPFDYVDERARPAVAGSTAGS